MEWWHFLLIAGAMVGTLMYFNRRAKAKEPYRTDYKPLTPKKVEGDDLQMEVLLNQHRLSKNLDEVLPDQLLFNLAKEHCRYMYANGKASHDNSKKRVFIMRTNNAIKTGECTADGFNDVEGFLHGYINHKHKKGKKKGQYTHRYVIEGDYTHYGHKMLYGEGNCNVLILAKF